eukprot:714737_1
MPSWIILISLIQILPIASSPSIPWYKRYITNCCGCTKEEQHAKIDGRLIVMHTTASQTSSKRDSARNPLVTASGISGLTATNYFTTNSKSYSRTLTLPFTVNTAQTDWQHVKKISHDIQSMSPIITRKHKLLWKPFDSGCNSTVNATLLVFDGRHTIFDSIEFSEQIVQILKQNDVPFIASQHNDHTLNIIRPHLIEFIERMTQLSSPYPLHLVLYFNCANMTENDIDELLSVITFVELCFDVNQIEQHFKAFVMVDDQYKTDTDLSRTVPLYAYRHVMVVDHHGIDAWRFEYTTPAELERRKKQFIPIQISALNLDRYQLQNDETIHDTFDALITA